MSQGKRSSFQGHCHINSSMGPSKNLEEPSNAGLEGKENEHGGEILSKGHGG